MEGKSIPKEQHDETIQHQKSSWISIHNAYVNTLDTLLVDTDNPTALTVGSYQDSYSINIPLDFLFSTGGLPDLQIKTTKKVISKA